MKTIARFCRIFICLTLALSGSDAVQAKPYDAGIAFASLTRSDGLPNQSVMAIERDADGYMWFATRSGLCRFDGSELEIFNESNSSLPDNYVSKLLCSADGSLWIGTIHGLARRECGTGEIRRYGPDKGVPSGGLSCLFSDDSGCIYAAIGQRLYRYLPESDSFKSVPLEKNITSAVPIQGTGSLLAGTTDGLYVLYPENGKMEPVLSVPAGTNVQAVVRDRRSNYWVGTKSFGLYHLGRDLSLVSNLRFPKLNNDFVRAVAEDRDGNIVVATYDGLNVLRMSVGDIKSYRLSSARRDDALTFFSVISLCCAPDGMLWVGSYVGGVNYANPYCESFLTRQTPDLDGIIGNVGPLVGSEDGLWIGMEGDGLLFMSASGTYSRVPVAESSVSYRSNIVSALCRNSGRLYVGFSDGSLACIDERSGKTLFKKMIKLDCQVMAISCGFGGTLYIGTWGEGNSSDFHVVGPDGVLRSDFYDSFGQAQTFLNVTSIVPSGEGCVFIAERDGGVARFDLLNGEVLRTRLVPENSQASAANVNHMIRTADGNLLAATYRCGLVRFDENLNILSCFSTDSGLPSRTINSVSEDDSGTIWAVSSEAVSSVDPVSGKVRSWLSPSDVEFNRRSVSSFGGKVWMGAGKYLVSFVPLAAGIISPAAPPRIVSVSLNGDRVPACERSSRLRITTARHLSLYFRSLDYMSANLVNYSYRIDGLDVKWMDLGHSPRVNIAGMRPGRYVFRTKAYLGAFDEEGVEGESLEFVVLPPLWRRWWMLLAYAVILTAACLCYVSFRRAKKKLDDERAGLRRLCESLAMESLEVNSGYEDSDFLRKVYDCINANIGNPTLNVERMCREVGASRTGLYYRLKKITGLSPMDFVRKTRLDVAMKLLSSGNTQISNVAEKVGFNSATYFSTAFKSAFGKTPSEYVNEIRDKNHLTNTQKQL